MPDVLLGVIVGWGLTTGAELARWSWRSRQSEREHKTALRRASRLILEELLVAERATRPRGDSPDPFEFDFRQRTLPTSVWNEHRETLAVAPEAADEWEAVASAFARIDELNWAMQRTEMRVSEAEALLAAREEIHAAIAAAERALRRLAA